MKKLKNVSAITILLFIFSMSNVYPVALPANLNQNTFLECFSSYDRIYHTFTQTDIIQRLFVDARIKLTLDVDLWEHIWQTIKNVDSFDVSEKEKQYLRLTMFFHDLGKVYGWKGHEQKSAAMCYEILTNIGFNTEHIMFICKMIEHHSDYGMFPKIENDLTLLSEYEVNMLYYVGLADIKTRKLFDSPPNRRKIKKLKSLLLSNREGLPKYKKSLAAIFRAILEHRAYANLKIFDLNLYVLKDCFFRFHEYDNVLNHSQMIMEAV